MKNKIFLLFFILSIGLSSQTKQGEIIYKVFSDKNNKKNILENDKISESQKQIALAFIKNTTSINCILKFKNYESLFYIEKGLNDPKNKILKISAGGNDIIYTNTNKNKEIIISKETLGQFFLVSKKFIDWELTNQSKVINGYKSFKAKGNKTVDTPNGIKIVHIIAWYTPEINIPFGPNIYNSLPGLILELHEGNLIYQVTKINLNKEITINKPIKGKKITDKELNQIFKKLYNERKKRNR